MRNLIMIISSHFLLIGGLLIFSSSYGLVSATSTFVVSFQSSGGWATDEWVEYDVEIPRLEEFTSCHWDKLRHFSVDFMTVWSYCIADRNNNANMNCTQLYYSGNGTSANQQVILSGWLDGGYGEFNINIESYRHRNWNHICWSYSSKTGINKFYYNGHVVGNVAITGAPVLGGADGFTITSFILGQEPNIFNGEYDPAQLFNGEVSELNVWDTVLNDRVIMKMAHCEHWPKGTVLSWVQNSIKNHGALIKGENDAESFCKQQKRFVIFPQRQPLHVAKDLCASHGGEIIVPLSTEENDDMISILYKHMDICLEANPTNIANTDKGTWLGLSKKDSIWYRLDSGGLLNPINFSNWDYTPQDLVQTDCTYARRDGKWSKPWNPKACNKLQLCTICSITGNPVFTVNGLCSSNALDYNYYLMTDENNTVDYYEGYRSANIILKNNEWVFVTKKHSGTTSSIKHEIGNVLTFPVGRLQWEVYDPECGILEAQRKQLSLSKCKVGQQFTCHSGACVDLQKRCNQIIDCVDGSDEHGCKLVQLPATYRKVQPPEPIDHSNPLYVTTFVQIISIDTIDTINMKVGLALKITMRCQEGRYLWS